MYSCDCTGWSHMKFKASENDCYTVLSLQGRLNKWVEYWVRSSKIASSLGITRCLRIIRCVINSGSEVKQISSLIKDKRYFSILSLLHSLNFIPPKAFQVRIVWASCNQTHLFASLPCIFHATIFLCVDIFC